MNQQQITIVTFTPVWRRPEIFSICLKGIKRLQQYNPNKYRIVPFFIVSEAEAAGQVINAGFDFIYHQNQPLGAKKNAGLHYILEKYDFDYIMEIGSDDLITNKYLDLIYPYMCENTPQITPQNCWFIDTLTAETAHWITDRVIGLGRCISREAILKLKPDGYNLWDANKQRGMDTYSLLNLQRRKISNTIIETNGKVYTLDIKSDVNINAITRFTSNQITPENLLSHFPEGPEISNILSKNIEHETRNP